jgi:uncharacterized protein Yka (UPF0111/DUF47 family)
VTRAWFSWVRSKDSEIMNVLEEQSRNLVKAASVLVESFSNYGSLKNNNSILKDLEHTGDNLTHKLFTIIDKTFVTPLDKEDISELTSTIDQVLDATYGTSDKLVLFRKSFLYRRQQTHKCIPVDKRRASIVQKWCADLLEDVQSDQKQI